MSVKTLIQFGAGNIGRGFIAPLFAQAGWRVVFVDIDEPRIAALNARGQYLVNEVTNASSNAVVVEPVAGILAGDGEAVVAEIAQADLLSTAVGLGALKFLGPNIAAGLAARQAAAAGPIDILVCENGIQATDLLAEAIQTNLPSELNLAESAGLVRTSIGRMIPPPPADADLLDVVVEPYACLPVESAAFLGTPPDLPTLKLADDFDLILRQKLYIHNASHACFAYLGQRLGYATIPDCLEDPHLVSLVTAAMEPVLVALALAHSRDPEGHKTLEAEHRALMSNLLERYTNRALSDDVGRVARDPMRKLAHDDRLMGAARLCHQQGLTPLALAHAILAACDYQPAADEPRAEDWRAMQGMGWRTTLQVTGHLKNEEPLMTTLTLAERQQQAADIIRAGGIAINDDEIPEIEIADFGLGRYEEIGLAIYVYVNTARVCAKELAMLPFMMCPEHIHPEVDGDNGKEPGKEETFRVRAGECFIYTPGITPGSTAEADKENALKKCPADKHDSVSVYHCHHLKVGDQLTLPPNTKHWFVAGAAGCVLSEFSTRSRDEADIFTDTEIQRVPDPV